MAARKVHAHPELMSKTDCEKTSEKIELALWGVDGRGGMVKDIGDIKSYMGVVRQVVVPVVIAVASSLLTAWIISGFRLF